MPPYHSYYNYGTQRSKEQEGGGGGNKVILWTEAEGLNDKVKEGHFFEGS